MRGYLRDSGSGLASSIPSTQAQLDYLGFASIVPETTIGNNDQTKQHRFFLFDWTIGWILEKLLPSSSPLIFSRIELHSVISLFLSGILKSSNLTFSGSIALLIFSPVSGLFCEACLA